MYQHSNLSTSSTGSYNRRISVNNPFRSALLQEEAKLIDISNSTGGSNDISDSDANYKKWLNKHVEEQEDDEDQDDSFSDNDENYYQVSRSTNTNTRGYRSNSSPGLKPRLLSTNSDSSVSMQNKFSNNPFAEALSPVSTGSLSQPPASQAPKRPPTQSPPVTSKPPTINRQAKPSYATDNNADDDYYDDHDLPPSYDDIVAPKYAKDGYPKDEKPPIADSTSNPFPQHSSRHHSSQRPRPSGDYQHHKTSERRSTPSDPNRPRRIDPSDPNRPRHHHTRQRSKSTSDAPLTSSSSRPHRSNQNLSSSPTKDRRPHQHTSSSHRSREQRKEVEREHHRQRSDRERDREHRRSSKKKSSSSTTEKPKNLDVIDKLDVTGFFNLGGFHHDGPFDACTPHRNKDTRAAPVMAFPADGPNSSIKGMAPLHTKEQQMDMVFGIGEEDPLYTTSVNKPTNGSTANSAQLHSSIPQGSSSSSTSPTSRAPALSTATTTNGKSPYSNGVVVKQATASESTLLDLKHNPGVVAFDSNIKSDRIHGDTTLGLGSSTFLDGAPAYGVEGGDLSRKKSVKKSDENGLLRRVKSLKVSRK